MVALGFRTLPCFSVAAVDEAVSDRSDALIAGTHLLSLERRDGEMLGTSF
jgi:hypothetical protein